MDIAEHIAKIGPAALARSSGVSRAHLTNVIAGRDRLSAPACVAVATAAGCEIADVVTAYGGAWAIIRLRLALAEGKDAREALS